MLTTKAWLFIALGGFGAVYIIIWVAACRRERSSEPIAPTPLLGGIGFVTTFFDTLGIGSFATATSLFKLRKLVKDEALPGTLNVGITLPTITQAFIYIAIVEVDMTTLILLIAASALGMWLGAGIVSGWTNPSAAHCGCNRLLRIRSLALVAQIELWRERVGSGPGHRK